MITYTARVDNATDGAFFVPLSNGVVINFADGATTGSSAAQPAQGDDGNIDAENFTVAITGTSGGNYEDFGSTSTRESVFIATVDATLATQDDVTVDDSQMITHPAHVEIATAIALFVTLDIGVLLHFADGA